MSSLGGGGGGHVRFLLEDDPGQEGSTSSKLIKHGISISLFSVIASVFIPRFFSQLDIDDKEHVADQKPASVVLYKNFCHLSR